MVIQMNNNIFKKFALLCVIIILGLPACCSAPHTTIHGIENQGLLKFIVEPSSAHVYIDDHDKGEADNYEDNDTPLIISSGLHKIQIKKEGYSTYQREIYVGGGSIHEIRATLEKEH